MLDQDDLTADGMSPEGANFSSRRRRPSVVFDFADHDHIQCHIVGMQLSGRYGRKLLRWAVNLGWTNDVFWTIFTEECQHNLHAMAARILRAAMTELPNDINGLATEARKYDVKRFLATFAQHFPDEARQLADELQLDLDLQAA